MSKTVSKTEKQSSKLVPTKFPSVYQKKFTDSKGRKDTSFTIIFWHKGKQIRKVVGRTSTNMNAFKANQELVKIRKGEYLPRQKKKSLKFKDYMQNDFLPEKEATNCRNGRCERSIYNEHLSRFDDYKLDQITVQDVVTLKNDMRKNGKSDATIVKVLKMLSHAFNRANRLDICKIDNPVRKVDKPKLNNDSQRYLTPEEEKSLFASFLDNGQQQLHDICYLSLYSGMRQGEIFDLRLSDLLFDLNQVLVRDPKNNESRRVPMHPTVRTMLLKYADIEKDPQDYIFKTRHNNKFTKLPPAFKNIVTECGLNKNVTDRRFLFTFHSLRHTYGSRLAQKGVELYTLKKLMGHKTIAMTLRYIKLRDDDMQAAVNLLDADYNASEDHED